MAKQAMASTSSSTMEARLESPSSHPFPRFPIEIRLMVWNLALPKGRIIPIYPSDFEGKGLHCVPAPPPALLHVNRESRAALHKRYELVDFDPRPLEFGASNLGGSDPSDISKYSIWIDWQKDVVYIMDPTPQWARVPEHWAWLAKKDSNLKKIQHLAINQCNVAKAAGCCGILPLVKSCTIVRQSILRPSMTFDRKPTDADDFYFVRASMFLNRSLWEDTYLRYCVETRVGRGLYEFGPRGVKVRFCDLLRDVDRKGESLDTEDELEDLANISVADLPFRIEIKRTLR